MAAAINAWAARDEMNSASRTTTDPSTVNPLIQLEAPAEGDNPEDDASERRPALACRETRVNRNPK